MSRPVEDAEILSVVDSTDSVIGEKRRDEIHLQGLRHRAVHVLVFNPKGAIFLWIFIAQNSASLNCVVMMNPRGVSLMSF